MFSFTNKEVTDKCNSEVVCSKIMEKAEADQNNIFSHVKYKIQTVFTCENITFSKYILYLMYMYLYFIT